MIWLTWRQHRAAALVGLLVLAACAVVLIPQGLAMRHAFDSQGLGRCAGGAQPADCANAWPNFQVAGATDQLTPWLVLLPLLTGVLLGAPVIAREFENGTYRLAWVQGTTRSRWITVKLATLTAGLITASAAFAGLVTWWRAPVDSLDTNNDLGRFGSFTFSVEGTVVIGYALFAFLLGVLAGALLRRTVPAMAAASVAFVAVLLGVQFLLRPHYLPPVTSLTAFPVTQHTDFSPEQAAAGDWVLDWGLVDPAGHRLTTAQLHDALRSASTAKISASTWLHDHDIRHLLVYQPADRFWTFQYVETGIFVALSAILLTIVIWQVRNRLP